MCNIEEDELPIANSPRGSLQGDRVCMKCSKAQAVVMVRLNDPLCKSCFMTYSTHKFRATIGKSRVIRHEDKVLLAVSGGPSSLAMLNMVAQGLSENVARKFRYIPGVVYIDEGIVLGLSEQERTEIKQQIKEFVVENGNFDFYEAKLEDLFASSGVQDGKDTEESATEKLRHCFNSVSSLTAKEDLLKTLRQQLILEVALKAGYLKLMVGDSATRISVRLLSSVSQGRGEALSYDTGFIDSHHGDVMILRPMREFVAKEVSLYNFFQGVEALSVPTLATKSGSYASIDRLTEEFVSGLQSQLSSTVNTIFRTGDKLTVKETKDLGYHCSLCGIPVELSFEHHTLGDLEELKLKDNNSKELNETGPGNCNNLSDVDNTTQNSCCAEAGCNSGVMTKLDLTKTLCYGCSLTVKDMKEGFDVLPWFAKQSAHRQMNQSEMKEQINKFLLEN